MKKYILTGILAGLSMLFTVSAGAETKAKPKAKKDIPATVVFDGNTYELKYSKGNQNEWLNEYLLTDTTFNDYHYMFTVRAYDGLIATPQEVGSSVVYNLQQSYPGAKYAFFPGLGKDAGLQFFIRNGNILEFNTFRFTMVNGRPLSLQFVYREYATPDTEKAVMEKMSRQLDKKMDVWKEKILTMPVPPIRK